MKFLKQNISYFLVIVLALLVRFVNLDKVPSALYYDEIDLGYQVRSLLETGKDYKGEQSPFYFSSFNTDKTPLPILFSAPISLFFSSPEYQVRAGTALAGVLVVVLSMVISTQLFAKKSISLITGLVFAFSPWLVHFSRLTFEAQFALLFLFIFLSLFYHFLKNSSARFLFYSAVSLGLSVYTYRTMSFLAPITFVVTFILFRKEILKQKWSTLAITAFIFGSLTLPFLYATTIGAKDQTRISQISIFSDPKIPIEVQRSRELVSGNFQNPTPGQTATLQSKVFHNKVLSYLDRLLKNTLNNFSPEFLFFTGDPNGRHSAKNTGELLFTDAFALLVGAYFLVHLIKDQKIKLLLACLLFGAIPANLTLDGANHASRLITFAGPLLIIVGFGYGKLFEIALKTKKGQAFFAIFVCLWAFSLLRFLNTYFFHFPIINSREFGFGYKQAILEIEKHKKDFDKIYLTGVNDPPMLYYFFWSKTPPKLVQEYGTEYNEDTIKGSSLDKVKPYFPVDLLCREKEIEKLDPANLYLVSYRQLPLDFRAEDKDPVPQGIKLLSVVLYPDNEVAYYLITRDTKDSKPILPLKGQTCK